MTLGFDIKLLLWWVALLLQLWWLAGGCLQNQKTICPPGGQTKTCAKYPLAETTNIFVCRNFRILGKVCFAHVWPHISPDIHIPIYPVFCWDCFHLSIYILNFSLSPGNRSQRKFRKSGLNSNLQLSPTSSKLSLIFLIKRSWCSRTCPSWKRH